MKPKAIAEMLSATLEDALLSRSERKALKQVLEEENLTPRDRATWLHAAFDLARERFYRTSDRAVLQWLEGIVNLLEPQEGPSKIFTRVYFSPGPACLNQLIQLISQSKECMDICVFTLTDDRLREPIAAAFKRGVTVRVVTDGDKTKDLGSDIWWLESHGIEVHHEFSKHHMHHKFAVFDQKIVVTGSYNWTRGAEQSNRENILVTNEPGAVHHYLDEFQSLWNEFAK